MAQKAKFYVVWKGRKTGVFTSWEACEVQVKGFTGAQYKAYTSREAAQRAFAGNFQVYAGKPASSGDWLFAPQPPIAKSISVDAACSGSPGRLEYRGVATDTRKQIFRQGPYANGTNNVGEFLAIVHALTWLKQKGMEMPVYSDSKTAIGWVKKKRCNTELAADETNAPLFELIQRAEDWLDENKVVIPIMKWDTRAWGEIPADFNRK
jgi:ribonuclease HI